MAAKGQRKPDEAALMEREQRAVALKASGATYRQIAQALSIDVATAHRTVTRALRRDHADAVDEMRRVEDDRLDRMLRAVWLEATNGNLGAIDRVVKISESRRRLWGLDAPQRHVVTTELDESIDSLLAELASLPPVDVPAADA